MMILSRSKGIEKTLSVENEESSTTECVCVREHKQLETEETE